MIRPSGARGVIAIVVAAGIAIASTIALAATFGLTSAALGAGEASVSRCDTDGFTITYTVTVSLITSVTVAGLADPGCEGGSLTVTLTDSSGASVGSGGPTTVPTDGDTSPNSMTLSVAPTPVETTVVGIHASLDGP
jgi:hypothetical protein